MNSQYKAQHTMADIMNTVYPVLVAEPEPKSLNSCYERMRGLERKWRDLEYSLFFAAVCYLATTKEIEMLGVGTERRVPGDYVLVLEGERARERERGVDGEGAEVQMIV